MKRAVVTATVRAMAGAATMMAMASERALTVVTKRVMESEGEGTGHGSWQGTKKAMVRVATNAMAMATTRALVVVGTWRGTKWAMARVTRAIVTNAVAAVAVVHASAVMAAIVIAAAATTATQCHCPQCSRSGCCNCPPL